MKIIDPPLNSMQRTTALASIAIAFKHHKHVGIRPTRDNPRHLSAGVKVLDKMNGDEAINQARGVWPGVSQMSVFGANDFVAGGMSAERDDDGDENPGGPESMGDDGDFNGCEECGSFEVPPGVSIASTGPGGPAGG
jgi:hypothetical protein